MYWLWKWLESYNNCTFSTWKDKCLFDLLFWIPNSFCTFHDYGRGGTTSLSSPDSTSLIFYHSEFWTCACPEKQSCPELFHCCEIFLIFRYFWATCAALKNRVCPEIFHCTECMVYIQDFWATCACPENRACSENFHYIKIVFIIQEFVQLALAPENRVCPEIFKTRGLPPPSPPPRAPMAKALGHKRDR